jgi:membrane protein required for beta-lactamase induction
MPRVRVALLCVPIALVGVGVAVHATFRVAAEERRLAELGETGRAAGESFVETLKGEHVERQLVAYDERRAVALSLAAARRDRLLGALAAVAAGLVAAGAVVLRRISEEVAEDQRHVAGQRRSDPP